MNKKIKTMLKQGNPCEIRLRSNEDVFQAELETIYDNDKLLVYIKDKQASIDGISKVEIALLQERIGVVKYEGMIQKCDSTENGFLLHIAVSHELDAVQRREFYRLSTIKNIHFLTKDRLRIDGFTENISAGGVKCLAKKPMAVGDEVGVKLAGGIEEYKLQGIVLECRESNSKQYQIRIQFTGLTDKEQAKLMSFILKEESKQAVKFRN